jgi:predicted nucleic acid-binding protein
VINWVDAHDSAELVITAPTAAEIRAGVALLPEGHRKHEIGIRMESLLLETFAGYVLAFDLDSSAYYAEILTTRTRGGRPISTFDAQIAAVCRQYESVLATRITADFADTGIQLVNPWDAKT